MHAIFHDTHIHQCHTNIHVVVSVVLCVLHRPASRALSSSLTMGPGVGDTDNGEPGIGDENAAVVTAQQRPPPHQQQAASVPDFLLRRSMVRDEPIDIHLFNVVVVVVFVI